MIENIDTFDSDVYDKIPLDHKIKDWINDSGFYMINVKYEDEGDLDDAWINYLNQNIYKRRVSDRKSIELTGETNKTRYTRLKNEFMTKNLNTEYVYVEGKEFEPLHITPKDDETLVSERKNKYTKILAGFMMRISDPVELLQYPYREEDIKQIALSTEGVKAKNKILFSKHKNADANKEIKEWLDGKIWGIPIYDGTRGYIFVKDDEKFYEFRIGNIPVVSKTPLKYFQVLSKEKKVYNIDDTVTPGIVKEEYDSILETYYEYGKDSDYLTESMIVSKMQEIDPDSVFTQLLMEDLLDKNDDSNKISVDTHVPFFTPYEMEVKGISYCGKNPLYSTTPDTLYINEKPIQEWFEDYKRKFNGMNSRDFTNQFQWNNKIQELCEGLDSLYGQELLDRKQSILDLGWNPEIPYNEDTQAYAKNRIENILNESYSIIEDYTDSYMNFKGNEEGSKIIYEVFYDKSVFGYKNMKVVYNESDISSLCKDNDECCIYAVKVPSSILENDIFIYGVNPKYCSNNTKIIAENVIKDSLEDYNIDPVIIKIHEGFFNEYKNIEDSEYNIDYILPLSESSVEFDSDGNLLISKGRNIDFESEYASTHLALQEYIKSDNLEGMKYCMCKLWYMNIVLEDNIHSTRNKAKLNEYYKARAKILNDIKTYMKIIIEKDPSFNIQEEYENSQFSKNKLRIKKSTIEYTIELFKSLLKLI